VSYLHNQNFSNPTIAEVCEMVLDLLQVAVTQSAFTEICKQMIDSSSGIYKDQVDAGVAKNQHDMHKVEEKITETDVSEQKVRATFLTQDEDDSRPFPDVLVDEIAALLKDGQTVQKRSLTDRAGCDFSNSVKEGKGNMYLDYSSNSSMPGHISVISRSSQWSKTHNADESQVS
jgi:hypothetical protein